jgi:16S rRNA (guanine966-N2)-methyltransferase
MRVIGGLAKGRRLRTGRGSEIRPTSDYLKEVIFDILGGLVRDGAFLDLFAGSGNVGIEALSRGAQEAIFVDSSPLSIRLIQNNLQVTGLLDRATLMRAKALPAMRSLESRGHRFRVIFIDPPYRRSLTLLTLTALSRFDLLEKGGLVIVEHFHKEELPPSVPGLIRTRQVRHGESELSFYARNEPLTHQEPK